MHSLKTKNNTKNNILITSENLFAGLPFADRVNSCVKMIEGKAYQFVNETSILLDLARSEASVYASCEAENQTDICAFLAQLDMEVQETAGYYVDKLRELNV